jgi:hypothetical protein
MIDLETPLREGLKEFLDSNYDLKVKVTGYAKHSSSYFPVVELKTFDSVSGEETLTSIVISFVPFTKFLTVISFTKGATRFP